MVIDFHTHIFPEKIAGGTVSYLEEQGGITAYSDGTREGLRASMKAAGVDISVVLPVVTKPSQFDSVNRYAAEITGKDGIISFGGIHPDCENYKEQLETIHGLGLIGVKIHPDYQQTFIDDEKNLRIIRHAVKLGLIVTIHAGVDIGFPDPIHCPPQRALTMLNKISEPTAKIVLAHTGGFDCWNQVEEYLVGENVFLDISYSLGFIEEKQLVRIIENHGADKILFASDSPWAGQKETLERFMSLPLSQEVRKKILFENAEKLIN